MDETEVLEWMTDQKNDASIEEIDREILFKYIETKEFLAVVFCTSLCFRVLLLTVPSFRQRRRSGQSADPAPRRAHRRRGRRVRDQDRQDEGPSHGEEIRLQRPPRHHLLPQRQTHQVRRRHRRRRRDSRLVDRPGEYGVDGPHRTGQPEDVREDQAKIRLRRRLFM
jgi:hypothetical protein